MILTEEAAKAKWCPHARVIFNHRTDGSAAHPPTHAATAYNRSSDPMPLSNCLGSGCMAWCWVNTPAVAERRGTCGMHGNGHQFGHSPCSAPDETASLNLPWSVKS